MNHGLIDKNYQDYVVLSGTWVEVEKRIKKVIKILDDNGIRYTTFKSIKPFNDVTVDIDLLILNSYDRALQRLKDFWV